MRSIGPDTGKDGAQRAGNGREDLHVNHDFMEKAVDRSRTQQTG